MSDYVEKYKCGSCKYYEYAGAYEKGYCSWYKAYYHADESCDNWCQNENCEPTSDSCFLTTACCSYKGLDDDCKELNEMRLFRDTVLQKTEQGKRCISLYYQSAPRILDQIEHSPNREDILEWIYNKIQYILGLIHEQKNQEAIIEYLLMVTEADIKSKETA